MAIGALAGCEGGGGQSALDVAPTAAGANVERLTVRVFSSPYEGVDWSTDRRLIAQHHDHVAARVDWLWAYDAAGYDVVSLMDYSGNAVLPYALRQRPWPASQWLPQSLTAHLRNIELFVPNAEEVGILGEPMKHATSPFLTSYIEGAPRTAPGSAELPLLPNQYRSVEQLFTLVRSLGGFPCLAHPFNFVWKNLALGESYCVEIYNAQAEMRREQGLLPYYLQADRNLSVVVAWDEVLHDNPAVFGIAVNDHVGPLAVPGSASDKVRDSGKIIVLAKAATLPAYERAFRAGSFFAVRDYGATKLQHPAVHSITVADTSIYIETTATVTWIAEGQVVGNEPLLLYRTLPLGTHYVRAEITGAAGSRVYTQAFPVRPVGDVNGDHNVDETDDAICNAAAELGTATLVEQRACAAARRG